MWTGCNRRPYKKFYPNDNTSFKLTCIKSRNSETKRLKWNKRNEQNETTVTKKTKLIKRNHRNDKNETNLATILKWPKWLQRNDRNYQNNIQLEGCWICLCFILLRKWYHVLWDKAFPVVWTNRRVESIKYIDEKLPCPNNAVHSF